MISTSELKTGVTLTLDGDLYVVVESQHVKPGKGGAFVRTKLRRLKTGSVVERTFRVGEKFQDAYIERRTLQFQYRSGETYHFMDMQTYEQVPFEEQTIGPGAGFLKEGMEIEGQFHEGRVIGLELPIFVDLRVDSTEPGVRGDTAKASNKPAKLETGVTIQVPLFVESDDVIRIDTRTGGYVSRV